MLTYIAYFLMICVIIITYLFKSKLLSLYFGSVFICDISGFLRQQFTNYPKPYTGFGLLLFIITTSLFLAIPMLTWQFAVYSFTKKIRVLPILCWITACIGLLSSYPNLRGQSMLNAFYSYYLLGGIITIIYFLYNSRLKFTFSQGGLLMAAVGSLITSLIAIKEISIFHLENWILIVLCNCMYYVVIIVCLILNHSAKKLSP